MLGAEDVRTLDVLPDACHVADVASEIRHAGLAERLYSAINNMPTVDHTTESQQCARTGSVMSCPVDKAYHTTVAKIQTARVWGVMPDIDSWASMPPRDSSSTYT